MTPDGLETGRGFSILSKQLIVAITYLQKKGSLLPTAC